MGAGGSTHSTTPAPLVKTKGATNNAAAASSANAQLQQQRAAGAAADVPRNYRFVSTFVPPGKAIKPKLIGFIQAKDELLGGAAAAVADDPTLSADTHHNNNNNNNMGWFVEDPLRPGQWEPYNDESNARLEAAFFSKKDSVMIVHKKHTFTVNLMTMVQLPSSSSSTAAAVGAASTAVKGGRMVRRAPAEEVVDPATGERTRRLAPVGTIDPFDDEGEATNANANAAADATFMAAAAAADSKERSLEALFSPATTPGSLADRAVKDNTFKDLYPYFLRDAKLHNGPIYTMAAWEAPQGAPGSDGAAGATIPVRLLSGGKDRSLVEWDPQEAVVTAEYALGTVAPNISILNAAISRSGRYAIVGMDDRDARVYALPALSDAAANSVAKDARGGGGAAPVTRDVLWKLKGHTHKVYGVDFVAGEEQCVTAGMDGVVCGWDLRAAPTAGKPHLQDTPLFSHHCHCSHIFAIKMSRVHGYFGVSVGDDKIVCVHDFRMANSVARRMAGHGKTIWNVDIHPDEQQLVTCGMDCTVKLWDLRQPGEARWTSTVHTKAVHGACFTPKGRGVLSCGKDQHVLLSETDSGEPVWRLRAHQASVFRALPVAGGRALATCAADAHAYLFRWEDGVNW